MPTSQKQHASFDGPHGASAIRSDERPFAMASLVYACRTREGVVFLDLRHDSYCGVGIHALSGLVPLVRGLPCCLEVESVLSTSPADDHGLTTAESLLAAGILTRGLDRRRTIPCRTVSTHGELIAMGDEIDYDVRIRASHVFNFIAACVAAKFALACLPFYRVVAHVHSARARRGSVGDSFDPVAAGELVSIFRRLRPFMFTAKGQCLFHALALVTFLRRYDRFASWVIGVKTNPWGAHSWVQEGNFILDTNPEKVCEFTAILAV